MSIILKGSIKDKSVTSLTSKSGAVSHYQAVMVEFDEERKKIDVRLPDEASAYPPGDYELDLSSMIDVREFFGQRRLIFKDFSSPTLRPARKLA